MRCVKGADSLVFSWSHWKAAGESLVLMDCQAARLALIMSADNVQMGDAGRPF